MASSEAVNEKKRPDVSFAASPNRPSAQRAAAARPRQGQAKDTAVRERPRNANTAAVKKRRKRRRRSKAPIVALVSFFSLVLIAGFVYFSGYMYYKDRFTANTYVNGVDLSGKSYEEAVALFVHDDLPEDFRVVLPSKNEVVIPLSAIDYKYSYEKELKSIYNDLDKKSWFAFLTRKTEYKFTDVASYDETKLMEQIDSCDWGSNENQNAQLKSGDDGYYVVPEVQGDVFDMDTLKSYIVKNLDRAAYTVNGIDSGAYVPPDTVEGDFDAKLETLNKMWNVKLYFNFDYTKELLTGKKLCKLIKVKRDGSYTVDEDACMKYIEKLAKKYDTYNTKRKFHATIQGDIVVPTSSDAKYGWWLDQQQCCDQLVKYLKNGKTKKNIKPIYYKEGNYEFTGFSSGRSEKDDIGKTYVEVDLTNQQFWYYKNGKKKRSGYIVSGQTTSAARTTLPGVYKVWQKATNYRMKDSNADGEEWDTTCNYWTRVAIVGIGLHDSAWRGAFGGTIYKYNGSHGCINMTVDDARYIYENVEMGTPVVMYY